MKYLFLLCLLFLVPSFAVEKDAPINKKKFSEAVDKEVEKRMLRLGQKTIVKLSQELLKKEEKLDLKYLELEKKEEQLKINIRQFESRIKEFQKRQSKFIGCLDDIDQKKNKRVGHIVDIISNMRPANASDVLSVQDTEVSVQIIGLLNATKLSKIFNKMDKEISARLQKQYMSMKR